MIDRLIDKKAGESVLTAIVSDVKDVSTENPVLVAGVDVLAVRE